MNSPKNKKAPKSSGQTYLQLFVPLDTIARWYIAVEKALGRVKPQDGHFHITVAFIKDKIDLVTAKKVAELLEEELHGMTAPTLVFDTVDGLLLLIGSGCGSQAPATTWGPIGCM